MRYTPWVVSEHVPDYSTLENILKHPRFAGKRGQDLAVALWELMVDPELGIFHYCPARNAFWGYDTYDPLQILNVYGFAICHVHANVLGTLGRAAGLKTRIANVQGHEGTEFFHDGKWRYFDCDLQMYHRLRPPREKTIASREDLYRDPSLVTDQPNPSRPYHLPDRLPGDVRTLYEAEPTYLPVLQERIHSMDFRLRPGEEMVRYFHHRGRWVVFENYPEMFKRFRAESGPEGPTERFWPRRQWGNGYFCYAPKLSSSYRDLELGAERVEGLALREEGLCCAGKSGSALFAFESPYIYGGIPDPMRRVPALEGAVLEAAFELPPGTAARIEGALESEEDGQTLWASGGASGEVNAAADFTPLADGQYRLRLRFVLEGAGARLRSFQTRLWFMLSPHALPALRRAGKNRMWLHSGDRHGLPTRTLLLEQMADRPECITRACRTENLRHDPESFARLLPQDPARPWELVYALSAPEGGAMRWLRAYALFEGRRPGEADDTAPARIELAQAPEGPWRIIAEQKIIPHPKGWHFGLWGEGKLPGPAPCAYVRFSAKKGAKGFRIAGHYTPAQPPPEDAPLEIEHVWYEDDPLFGRRERRHVERTTARSHAYEVRCAHEPHNERLALRVPSLKKQEGPSHEHTGQAEA